MKRTLCTLGALVLLAGLAWSYAACDRSETGSTDNGGSFVQSDRGVPATLAARYHLRSRTKSFFQRGGTSWSRRVRTEAGRGSFRTVHPTVKPTVKPNVRPVEPTTNEAIETVVPAADDTAARYHLRNRTKKFYKRVVC